MNTPVYDFINEYINSEKVRMHMPGHKGVEHIGVEEMDITEINGSDSLYRSNGAILESEKNAASLFGSKRTVYSAEGSSHAVKAMLQLILLEWKKSAKEGEKPVIIAGRNAHISFIHAVALLGIDVEWIYGNDVSICSCSFDTGTLEGTIRNTSNPVAVYVTSPDYLGRAVDIREISKVCKRNNVKLLVDNAHGAYFKFLNRKKYPQYVHPMEAGAYMCNDSAHKTLPVLTGGAYLHLSEDCSEDLIANAKSALALFGSTSPSYLILASLDKCNEYLSEGYREKLDEFCGYTEEIKRKIKENGWMVSESDPLKITIEAPLELGGEAVADKLRKNGFEPEYADNNNVVLMITMDTKRESLEKLVSVLGKNTNVYTKNDIVHIVKHRKAMTIREAILSGKELIDGSEAIGRICAETKVKCPPGIPEYVPGEIIESIMEGKLLCVMKKKGKM